jgi:hypothetical protein
MAVSLGEPYRKAALAAGSTSTNVRKRTYGGKGPLDVR